MTGFAHPAEEDVAKVLDYYSIEWTYEKKTFVLDQDEDGQITRAFCPDFYLPAFDLYIEITTQRPRLQGKKNNKIRRTKEKYGVSVVLMNKTAVASFRKKFAFILDNPENSAIVKP